VRVDEIHVQLVTLRQVPNAQQLSRNLAQKMEEISNRLQKATLEVSDLKGQLMTRQINIQDRLAELTLTPSKDAAEPKAPATTAATP
jgi:Skp family chaperone for outer membrane proteins